MKKIIVFLPLFLYSVFSFAQERAACEPPQCTPACKDAVAISKEVPPGWATSFWKADFNNDGKEDLLFVCHENNKLYLKFADAYKKVKLLAELDFADVFPFEGSDYAFLRPEERDFEGDKLRIFEIRTAISGPNQTATPAAFVLLRNDKLHKVIYGYRVDIFWEKLQRNERNRELIDKKMFLTEKSLEPKFAGQKFKDWAFVALYENEYTPIEITVPVLNKQSDTRAHVFGNIFGDKSEKLQKMYVWEKKGLREVYSR